MVTPSFPLPERIQANNIYREKILSANTAKAPAKAPPPRSDAQLCCTALCRGHKGHPEPPGPGREARPGSGKVATETRASPGAAGPAWQMNLINFFCHWVFAKQRGEMPGMGGCPKLLLRTGGLHWGNSPTTQRLPAA